jgi:dihydrodipicolinate synthase/N-acetylneuraminate lyase
MASILMSDTTTAAARQQLIERILPGGVPTLWCPPLTHFRAPGQLDEKRIRRHLEVLSPFVKGILVPGSTGEGWEMNDDEAWSLLSVVLDAARTLGIKVLVGTLKPRTDEVLAAIDRALDWIRDKTAGDVDLDALLAQGIAGFTVCPPKGSELTQDQIAASLGEVLERGFPVALYQLPQVTENEMHAETVAQLAARYANFMLFKDTSGQDRVAQARPDLGGVFLVRGAEGEYCRWLKPAGGPYDGFLLSTANCFAREYAQLRDLLEAGDRDEADRLSSRLETVVNACFDLVSEFPTGNPFTNANKTLDHILAHGPQALTAPAPLLYSGVRLPVTFVERAYELLRDQDLMPDAGYL